MRRCNIPGNEDNVSRDKSSLSPEWKNIVFNEWLGIKYENHIESLAKRWLYFYEIYKKNKDNITLIKYEDFLSDKIGFIENIAREINMPVRKNISGFVDIDFQPSRKTNDVNRFVLSEKNRKIVISVCSKALDELGYSYP